jgi:hypothetical protein
MRLLSARLLVPLAAVVVVWGGTHLFTAHNLSVTPAVWPAAVPSQSPTVDAAALSPPVLPQPPSPTAGAIPLLPGALVQLNGSTRDTAIGLYALIQQLEAALRAHLEQLVQRLEPGR